MLGKSLFSAGAFSCYLAHLSVEHFLCSALIGDRFFCVIVHFVVEHLRDKVPFYSGHVLMTWINFTLRHLFDGARSCCWALLSYESLCHHPIIIAHFSWLDCKWGSDIKYGLEFVVLHNNHKL